MLESFLQSQKYSISKNLRKKFNNYLTVQEDHNQLLIALLNRLVKDKVIKYNIKIISYLLNQLQYLKYFKKFTEVPQDIIIKQEQFERDSQEFGVFTFTDFYNSNVFKLKNRLENKEIICSLRD